MGKITISVDRKVEEVKRNFDLDYEVSKARRDHFAVEVGKLKDWCIRTDVEESIIEEVIRAMQKAEDYYKDII